MAEKAPDPKKAAAAGAEAKPDTAPAPPSPSAASSPATAPPPPAATPALPNQPVLREEEEAPKGPPEPNRPLQIVVETVPIITFLALALVPLVRFGLIPLGQSGVDAVLVVSSLLLTAGVLLFEPANFTAKKRKLDEQIMRKYRRDLILTSLSVGGTIVVALMLFLEGAALLAFLGFVSRTSEASVAFAENYVLFATFTLLFCSMLLIVRTSFETRATVKPWHKGVSWGLLATASVIALVALLVSFGVLDQGPFANVEPRQSIYILTMAVLFQIVSFKILLKYPAIAQIVVKEIDAARRANKELRDVIQKRALRAYLGGLAFVLISMFLLGGVATQRLPVQNDRTLNFIVIIYTLLGLIVMGIVVTRYFQHRYLDARARRAHEGDLIAKRRLSRAELNLRVMYIFSGLFGGVFLIAGILVLAGKVGGVHPKYGTDLLITAFLTGVGPYGWYRGRRLKRIRAMDDKFPVGSPGTELEFAL